MNSWIPGYENWASNQSSKSQLIRGQACAQDTRCLKYYLDLDLTVAADRIIATLEKTGCYRGSARRSIFLKIEMSTAE